MNKPQLARVVAGCVICKDGKYLLVQEKKSSVYGLWNLPAGHVDEGETIEEAAIREVFEETGYRVELGKKLSVEHTSIDRPVLHAFVGNIAGGDLKPDLDELLAADWFSVEEIERLSGEGKMRNTWVLKTIKESEA
jgi:NADH pyrophosphatase NudC (nudix superfamily)